MCNSFSKALDLAWGGHLACPYSDGQDAYPTKLLIACPYSDGQDAYPTKLLNQVAHRVNECLHQGDAV